ncbi:hypothetical protein R3P38DRAFT_3113735 [Favolaschia claudopus]|uniref:F-box domain-containing protein n=1 Tax=Favolaschia claudopus TaxID=2862362 RepID=A0AAV9ZHR9_9AGAR
MVFPDQVPDELWLEILQLVPRKSLQNVALTHRTLRRTSRGFLFDSLVFAPFSLGHWPDKSNTRWDYDYSPKCLSDRAHERELERLEFWSSPEIAPFVRSCKAIPIETKMLTGDRSPTSLVEVFFNKLPCFTSLQHLDVYAVHFTHIGLQNLCHLPALRHLELTVCHVADSVDLEASQLRLETVDCFALRHLRPTDALPPWINLLHPERLVEMHLTFCPAYIAHIAHSLPYFPAVKRFSILLPPDEATSAPRQTSNIYPLLPKFPNIEKLEVYCFWLAQAYSSVDDVPDAFPLLTEYHGPAEMLPVIISRSNLQRLWITSYLEPSILQNLQDMPTHNVVNFVIIYRQFARIRSGKSAPFVKSLGELPSLPSTLKHMSIRWMHVYGEPNEDDEPILDSDKSELFVKLSTLVNRSPGIKSMWIESDGFLYRWRRLKNGKEEELTMDHDDEEVDLHQDWKIFWDER